jgi:NifU-like protein involved in Fe-S cluster formation
MYTRQVADHIARPRNVGELDDPSGTGDVTNEVCLDRIRLTIRVADNRLVDAKVKAYGCPPTIAAASALTELIIGRTIVGAESLTRTDLIAALGRLPAAKMHCAVLAVDALRSALADARRGA